MLDNFVITVSAFTLVLVGNFLGDTKTLRDCATKGTAEMLSGGTIKCEVIKSTKEFK